MGRTRVIVVLKPGVDPSQHVKELGGRIVRQLKVIDAIVVDLPAGKIRKLAEQTDLVSLHFDRPVKGHSNRAAVTIGARAVQSDWATTAPASASRSSTRASRPGTTT